MKAIIHPILLQISRRFRLPSSPRIFLGPAPPVVSLATCHGLPSRRFGRFGRGRRAYINAILMGFLMLFGLLKLPMALGETAKLDTRGATEDTPSLSQYFSWINNTNEGSNEEQTLINLEFFQWLHDEYGMILDIYAFDAGNIDGPGYYGSTKTEKFKNQFPNGFKPIYEKAKAMDCRLGVWLGPDGFGNTPEQEAARNDMLVKFCKEYEFLLFKVDAVCTQLRPEKQDAFARLMTECRKFSPDLILLNHRLELGHAEKHATTFLWRGEESYIDVHMANNQTGTHNRVGALSRGLVPDLKRLTEDTGVCISSCLDFWDDDLILQAFNRSLILAPEIYANPWFLRDNEFPKLARIYNLHRRYRDILTKGIVLPEKQYGPNAVSRGDNGRRLITLRNLTWEPVKYKIDLDESIGLKGKGWASLYQFHPTEKFLGETSENRKSIEVEVMPFRSCLLLATTDKNPEVVVKGCDYEVVRDTKGKDVIVNVMGYPGTKANISLETGSESFARVRMEGKPADELLKGKALEVIFEGDKIKNPWHRKLGDLRECPIPKDAETLYEATCFSTDSDPLEYRSLRRSGPTQIKQVQNARDAFLNQWMYKERGIDPSYLFDGNPETVYTFKAFRRFVREKNLRIDFGKVIDIDTLTILIGDQTRKSKDPMSGSGGRPPIEPESYIAEVSANLKTWKPAELILGKTEAKIRIPAGTNVRYLRTNHVPRKVKDITGHYRNVALATTGWRSSYFFNRLANRPIVKAFSLKFNLDEYVEGSYICVPLDGEHGTEGAFAALKYSSSKLNDPSGGEISKGEMVQEYVGAPRRAPSYQSNAWEYGVRSRDSNYTYFIPVTKDMLGKPLELVVLAMDKDKLDFKPSAWITTNPIPMVKKQLVISRK
jgi:hypothetical protein